MLPPLPEKPILQLADKDWPQLIKQAQQILSNAGIFRQGNMLVRIGESQEIAKDASEFNSRRDPLQGSLISVSAEYICEVLTEGATIEKYDGRSKRWTQTKCPYALAKAVLNRGTWPYIRPLSAIVHAPFIREDGTICDLSGYDEDSAAYLIPNAEFPSVPDQVSKAQACEALDTLLGPFKEFPFQTEAMRSAFVAHILTEAARLAIDRAPAFWYTAQYASTGKTMLSEMAVRIVHGVEPAVRPWVSDGSELRKTLFASLLAGDRSIAFDNLPTGCKVRAPELCAFLTSAKWQDRKLGESSVPTVANTPVVSASGNNVTPAGDLARRSVVIRLDANTPELKGRVFEIDDLRGHVREQRVQLLIAALTVIRGHQHSSHKGPTPLASFERWSRFVRDPLLWLEMEDPLDSQSETDDESGKIGEAFSLLAAAFGERAFTPGQVLAHVRSIINADGQVSTALQNGGCSDPHDAQKIGYWLRECRDKFGAGHKLEWLPVSQGHSKRYRFKLNADLVS